MSLFWKVFSSVLVSFVLVFLTTFFVLAEQQVSAAQKNIVEQYQVLGDYLGKALEVGYLESRWPFENLKTLSERPNFLFWWVVKNDNTIHLADKASFMGTKADAYFPDIKQYPNENVIINSEQNYGISIKTFVAGRTTWTFWMGFSLKEVAQIRREAYSMAVGLSVLGVLLIGAILYFVIRHTLKPIQQLVEGTKTVASGNLDYQIPRVSNDELGALALSFNQMTRDLKKTRSEIEKHNSELEDAVAQRTKDLNEKMAELARINKLMVGRELKMIELKEQISKGNR